VGAAGAGAVVVATGATWTRPEVSGADLDHVLTVPQLRAWLDGDDEPAVGAHVVVVGGGKTGLSLADLCLRRGRSVAVVEPTNVFGVELGLPGRFRLVHDVEAAGARLVGNAVVEAITAAGVAVRRDDGGADELDADTVLVASGATPDGGLADALAGDGIAVHAVGDCVGAGGLEAANLRAAELALALDAAPDW